MAWEYDASEATDGKAQYIQADDSVEPFHAAIGLLAVFLPIWLFGCCCCGCLSPSCRCCPKWCPRLGWPSWLPWWLTPYACRKRFQAPDRLVKIGSFQPCAINQNGSQNAGRNLQCMYTVTSSWSSQQVAQTRSAPMVWNQSTSGGVEWNQRHKFRVTSDRASISFEVKEPAWCCPKRRGTAKLQLLDLPDQYEGSVELSDGKGNVVGTLQIKVEEEPPPPTTVCVGDQEVPTNTLRQRKELLTAYLLYFCGGYFGAHHFYLDRVAHGVLAAFTWNFLFIGIVVDWFCMNAYVKNYNKKVAPFAHSDGSFNRLKWRLPCIPVGIAIVVSVVFCKGPDLLHKASILDVDALLAKTNENPYVLLGVPRGTSPWEAAEAYHDAIRALERSPDCILKPLVCKGKKKELSKAMEFMRGGWREEYGGAYKKTKKERAKHNAAQSNMDDYLEYKIAEWTAIGHKTRAVFNELIAKISHGGLSADTVWMVLNFFRGPR